MGQFSRRRVAMFVAGGTTLDTAFLGSVLGAGLHPVTHS